MDGGGLRSTFLIMKSMVVIIPGLGQTAYVQKLRVGNGSVSYYGTKLQSAKEIADKGYKAGPRQRFGKGVYSSSSLEMVDREYAQEFTHKGKNYKVAMQNRVNPDQAGGHLEIIDKSRTGVGADYWVCHKHDTSKGIYDIRPYGILIREI